MDIRTFGLGPYHLSDRSYVPVKVLKQHNKRLMEFCVRAAGSMLKKLDITEGKGS